MTIEEIVVAYKGAPKGRANSLVVRCETTGEQGSVRSFAERIAAVRNTKLSTERAKLYRAITLEKAYRNLRFSVVG